MNEDYVEQKTPSPPLEADPAPGKIFTAIPAVMNDIEAVSKGRKNVEQNFSYRGIDDIYNAVHNAFAKHKVFTMTKQLKRVDSERTTRSGSKMYHSLITFRIRFYAEDGSFVDTVLDGEGMDTGDKRTNKCISIAQKYALLTALAIPTEELEDADAESVDRKPENAKPAPAKPVTKLPQKNPVSTSAQKPAHERPSTAQLKRLFTIADEREWTKEQVKMYMQARWNLESTKDLTVDQYDAFCTTMTQKAFGPARAELIANGVVGPDMPGG